MNLAVRLFAASATGGAAARLILISEARAEALEAVALCAIVAVGLVTIAIARRFA